MAVRSRIPVPLTVVALVLLALPNLPLVQAAESLSARLLDLDAFYGQEVWKYDPIYEGPASPQQTAGHIQNRSASYYGALGLRVTFAIQLYDTQDPMRRVQDSAYNVTAWVQTLNGALYGYVRRAPGSAPGPSDSDTFYLDFDLDGTNNGDPLGRFPPALEPGSRSVHVDVTKRQQDVPPTRIVGSADLPFSYEIPATTVTIPAFANLPYLQVVPDEMFRLYNDVGWGQSVLFVDRGLPMAAGLQVTYQFSTSNLPVKLFGFLAERGVATPVGPAPAGTPSPPIIPGITDNETLQNQFNVADALVVMNRKQLAEAVTGPDGSVTFTLTGDDLLRIRATAPGAALVVVAPLLESTAANPVVGATELVVPVSESRARIDRYRLVESSGGATGAPDALRALLMSVNGLQVDVADLDGFLNQNPPQIRTGDLVALVPDVRNSQALSGASLAPSQSENNLLRGTLPVRPIQEQGVSHYRVFALLYRENDVFYGLTFGDRGYEIRLASLPAPVGTAATMFLNLTSRTTDYDLLLGERDFDLRVLARITVRDLNFNKTQSYTLTEGGILSTAWPFSSSRAGEVRVDVSSTSGDVVPRDLRVNLVFFEPPPKKTLVDRLPGFEAPLLLAAMALAVALFWGRRVR